MMNKKHLLILLACVALVVSVLSCAPQQGEKRLELRLEKAPRLNEPVELTCIRTAILDIPNEKININFEWIEPKRDRVVEVSPEDMLVEGNFNWEAAVKKDVPTEFSAIIKFPHEGNWRVRAVSTSPGWDSDDISLYVAEDSGMFGWQEDYRTPTAYPYPYTPSERAPMTVQVDISKAARLDEPAELTWVINSIRDIAKANGEIEFYRMEGTGGKEMPADDILVQGDLSWEGSLKKDTPIQLSAIIRFPQEGDWQIVARGHSPEQVSGCADGLFLHVGEEEGRFGWVEPHMKKPSPGPPPSP